MFFVKTLFSHCVKYHNLYLYKEENWLAQSHRQNQWQHGSSLWYVFAPSKWFGHIVSSALICAFCAGICLTNQWSKSSCERDECLTPALQVGLFILFFFKNNNNNKEHLWISWTWSKSVIFSSHKKAYYLHNPFPLIHKWMIFFTIFFFFFR